LANDLGAIFQETSAKNGKGIDKLFEKIGNKFINPNSIDNNNNDKEENDKKGVVLSQTTSKKKTKKCC